MDKRQRKVFIGLILAGLLYFTLFISPNLVGARDANMLALFEVDEYAQYPHVIRMLTLGDTFYQSVRNFAVYQHYFYGYPFYFFSALALLPVKLILGADWAAKTPILVATLRQSINVLPMLAAVLLLVWTQTRFRPAWKAAGLFLLLLIVPGVVVNDLWWHPDSLVFLFVTLTLFFLDRDDLRFGRNFLFAAAACGLAAGTKHLGLFYVLAIPLYLAWGLVAKRISWKRAGLLAVLFVAVMALALVISNPLLLLPQERAEIIAVQKLQVVQTGTGIFLANKASFLEKGRYPEDLRIHYGELGFIFLAFLALAIGLARRDRRRLNALILAWMIPLAVVIFTSGTRRTHYFIPLLMPLFSSLVNLFPPDLSFTTQAPEAGGEVGKRFVKPRMAHILALVAGIALAAQAGLFVRADVGIYRQYLSREDTSTSLLFTDRIDTAVLARLPNPPGVVYRDWRIYFPALPGQRVEMDWSLASYPLIEDLKPDLILLESENVNLFSQPQVVDEAVDPDKMKLTHEFYRDAAQGELRGYKLVFQNTFGYAFVKSELAVYFQKTCKCNE